MPAWRESYDRFEDELIAWLEDISFKCELTQAQRRILRDLTATIKNFAEISWARPPRRHAPRYDWIYLVARVQDIATRTGLSDDERVSLIVQWGQRVVEVSWQVQVSSSAGWCSFWSICSA